jgi:TonB family protein
MRLVFGLALTTICLLAQDAPAPQDSRSWLNQGIQAYKSGRYQEATDAFQRAVDLDPSGLNARLYLATAWMSQYIPGAESPDNSRFARRAETEFMEVLRLDPNNKTATVSLASLNYQQAQGVSDPSQKALKLEQSESWYQKAVEIDPQDKTSFYSLGVIDWVRFYSAWLSTRANLGMKPEDPGPLPITAIREQLKAQYSSVIGRGISNLEKALAIDPQYDDAMAYINLLIRERADLRDTPEEYRRDVESADQWVQKTLQTKRLKAQAEATIASAPATPRIRVGGNVQQANLVHKVDPVYPALAKQAAIQGVVHFTVIIDRNGGIQNVQLLSGHPLLVEAARDAVQQWSYKPTLLNGQPVEVLTTVDVNFTLQP